MPAPDLQITTVRTVDQVAIGIAGDLTFDTSQHLLDAASTVLTSPPERLILDMKRVVFSDSTGLSCLVRIHHLSAATGVDLLITNVPAPLSRRFVMAGLDQLFNTTPAP